VLATLETYAKRGIFRAYGVQPGSRGRQHISFRWHADAVFRIDYDPARQALTFRDLLPYVEPRSSMDRELRAFVRGASSTTLPEHRRLDARKAGVSVARREGTLSLQVQLKRAHVEYGVRKAVVLVHEIFVSFLRAPQFFPYMVEHFGVSPDQ